MSMCFRLFRACQLCLAFALCVAILPAQTGVGQIQGNVTDASGAIVPHASVTLENISTDSRFQTTTSDAGVYVFPSLVPGEYKINISVPGMQKWEGKTTLLAGQRAVINASLDIAKATEKPVWKAGSQYAPK